MNSPFMGADNNCLAYIPPRTEPLPSTLGEMVAQFFFFSLNQNLLPIPPITDSKLSPVCMLFRRGQDSAHIASPELGLVLPKLPELP